MCTGRARACGGLRGTNAPGLLWASLCRGKVPPAPRGPFLAERRRPAVLWCWGRGTRCAHRRAQGTGALLGAGGASGGGRRRPGPAPPFLAGKRGLLPTCPAAASRGEPGSLRGRPLNRLVALVAQRAFDNRCCCCYAANVHLMASHYPLRPLSQADLLSSRSLRTPGGLRGIQGFPLPAQPSPEKRATPVQRRPGLHLPLQL